MLLNPAQGNIPDAPKSGRPGTTRPAMQGPRACTQLLGSERAHLSRLSNRRYANTHAHTHTLILPTQLPLPDAHFHPSPAPSQSRGGTCPAACHINDLRAPARADMRRVRCAPANSHQPRARAVCSSGYSPAPARITPPVHAITCRPHGSRAHPAAQSGGSISTKLHYLIIAAVGTAHQDYGAHLCHHPSGSEPAGSHVPILAGRASMQLQANGL